MKFLDGTMPFGVTRAAFFKGAALALGLTVSASAATNPIITNIFTADPAALVYNDTVYIYAGHDEATVGKDEYVMKNWHIISSGDMDKWVDRGEALSIDSFKWMTWHAWASQTIERNGKFYWYVTGWDGKDFAIGVAVANHPAGPFKDALGKPLITSAMTPGKEVNYDIDPTVMIDDDGQAYIYWGNGAVKGYRLKENMIELEGQMFDITPPMFTEAAFMHKRKDYYFLTYAYGWEERIGQATSKSPTGPVSNSKVIVGYNDNSNTSHQAFIEFHNQWYYIYHTGSIGGSFRRAVAVDYCYYENDSTIANITMTKQGVKKVNHAPLKNGVYRIKAKHSGLSLDGAGGNVIQMDQEESWSQLWALNRVNGYSYTLKNVETGKYLTFGKGDLLDTVKTAAEARQFIIENFNVEDGYRLYADTASEYVADVLNISKESGMPLVVWKQTGTLNQSYIFQYMGDESEYVVDEPEEESSSSEVPQSSSSEALPTTSDSENSVSSSSEALATSSSENPASSGSDAAADSSGVNAPADSTQSLHVSALQPHVGIVSVSRTVLLFSAPTDYMLMDAQGVVISRGHQASISLAGAPAGMYFVKFGGKIQKIRI